MPHARFLVLDGPDGCGKSTQARLLHAALEERGLRALHLREPGGTKIGERVRAILLDPDHDEMSVRAELLLYMASRAQLVEQVIRPALASGTHVVCERFLSASIVYQGIAGGLGERAVRRIGRFAVNGVQPDLTLVLDVDPGLGLSRVGKHPDRMERKALSFHRAVRAGFRRLAREAPGKVRCIDARAAVVTVYARILNEVDPLL